MRAASPDRAGAVRRSGAFEKSYQTSAHSTPSAHAQRNAPGCAAMQPSVTVNSSSMGSIEVHSLIGSKLRSLRRSRR